MILGLFALVSLAMWLTRLRSGSRAPEGDRWADPALQGFFDHARSGGPRLENPRTAAQRRAEALWEKRALTQLRGDRAALERLVAYEARRGGRASRAELLQRVYEEHRRDQR